MEALEVQARPAVLVAPQLDGLVVDTPYGVRDAVGDVGRDRVPGGHQLPDLGVLEHVDGAEQGRRDTCGATTVLLVEVDVALDLDSVVVPFSVTHVQVAQYRSQPDSSNRLGGLPGSGANEPVAVRGEVLHGREEGVGADEGLEGSEGPKGGVGVYSSGGPNDGGGDADEEAVTGVGSPGLPVSFTFARKGRAVEGGVFCDKSNGPCGVGQLPPSSGDTADLGSARHLVLTSGCDGPGCLTSCGGSSLGDTQAADSRGHRVPSVHPVHSRVVGQVEEAVEAGTHHILGTTGDVVGHGDVGPSGPACETFDQRGTGTIHPPEPGSSRGSGGNVA